MPYFRGSHLSFRTKSRNGASGASDIDGCAARAAARESGDERVNLCCLGKTLSTMSPKLSEKKLVVLGAGKLGGILLRAYLKQRLFVSGRVTATVRHAERAAALAKELSIAVTTDNREVVRGADIQVSSSSNSLRPLVASATKWQWSERCQTPLPLSAAA